MTYLENLYKRIRELHEKELTLTEQIKNEKDENRAMSLIFTRMRICQKIRVTQRQIDYEQANDAFKEYKKRIEG